MSTEQVTQSTDGKQPTVPPKFPEWNNKHFQINGAMARKLRFEREMYLKQQVGKEQVRKNRPLPTTPPTKVDTTAPKVDTKQTTAPKTTGVPQLPPVPKLPDEVRRKAILGRLEALKDDLNRAGKVPGTTPEIQNLQGEVTNAKSKLMLALKAPNYDNGETEIAKLEKATAKLCFLESKSRVRSVEKAIGDSLSDKSPGRTRMTGVIETAVDESGVDQLQNAIDSTYDDNSIAEIENKTGAGDSKIGVVTAAMRNVGTAQQNLLSGKGGNIGALRKAVQELETAAQTYLKEHKSALTKDGKDRITAAKTMLQTAQNTLKAFDEADTKAQAAIDQVRKCDPANLTNAMLSKLDVLGQEKYVTAATQSMAQFAVTDGRKRLERFEDQQLLQTATAIEKMSVNDRSASMVNALEAKLKESQTRRTVESGVKKKVEEVIKMAREQLNQQAQKLLSDPSLDTQQKAEIMISRCGAKPPSGKGESDSFFVYGPDGKPSYIFKPQKGENSKFGQEGAGVAREILTGKFNDVMKNVVPGLDFGVSQTSIARLDSESLANGTLSKDTNRMGALQQAIPNEGNLTELFGKDPSNLAKIPDEDVQKIAILDFITLQTDRNCDNLLIQDDNGSKRLKPIDGGFSFPPTDMFKTYGGGMCSNGKASPQRPMVAGENAVTQLPQSDKPFSPTMLKLIGDMKPDLIVSQMKQANIDMENEAPELKGMVDPKTFDNVGRSIKFLQKAAKDLTPAQLSEVYALRFGSVLEASDTDFDTLADEVIKTAKDKPAYDKEMSNRDDEYKKLGGDAELKKLGWDPTDPDISQDLKRKIEILQKPNANKPPKYPTKPPDPPSIDARYLTAGGDNGIQAMNQAGDTSATMQNDVYARAVALENYNKFLALGGDAEFKIASTKNDPRVKPCRNPNLTAEKLRVLEDYQTVAKDGTEYDRLGGDKKYEELLNQYLESSYLKASPIAKRLAYLNINAEYQQLGGDAAFLRYIRKWRANSSTLYENLDTAAKKIAVAFTKYNTGKWIPEDARSMLDRLAVVKGCT